MKRITKDKVSKFSLSPEGTLLLVYAIAFMILVAITSCSMDLEHSGKVACEFTVDDAKLRPYFKAKCVADLGPEAAEEEVEICTDVAIADFIISLSDLFGGI